MLFVFNSRALFLFLALPLLLSCNRSTFADTASVHATNEEVPGGKHPVYFQLDADTKTVIDQVVDGNSQLNQHGESMVCNILDSGDVECEGDVFHKEHTPLGTTTILLYSVICCGLVLFAGLMSGLTLGLLSLDFLNLKVLQRGGDPKQRKYANQILPLVKKRHLLLVTLLLWNAAAMETLPIFLDRMVSSVIAIVISVTAVLLFGEIIPQALCAHYGLAIGAKLAWLVKGLMYLTFIVSWPISILLDLVLGEESAVFYRRTELKELVSIHAADNTEGEGGPLTTDECTIIKGALDMKTKTVQDAMTPIESVFMLDISRRLDQRTRREILESGHSRIPIYAADRQNIKGELLVKSLIMLAPEDEKSLSGVELRDLPTVLSYMPMYDMLNEFQTGRSHMVAIRNPDTNQIVGIITLEDVIEELIQEEIIDETDVYIDIARRTRVARILKQIRPITSPTMLKGKSPRIRRVKSADLRSTIRSKGQIQPTGPMSTPNSPQSGSNNSNSNTNDNSNINNSSQTPSVNWKESYGGDQKP